MYNISDINIGEILKKYRKIKGLSLEFVGNTICKTKSTISKYEKGEIIPDFRTVLELFNVLDLNISEVIPFVSPISYNTLPFNANTLYLYYLSEKKLVRSLIEIKIGNNNKYNAFLYNGLKKDKTKYAYYYEGTLDCSDHILYMDFRNMNSNKFEMEKVQLIVNIPLSNNTNFYNCFISGLTPNFTPVIKKGILSTMPLENLKKLSQKLKISKEELKQISETNNWILHLKQYDESFYDFDINMQKK